MRGGPRNCPHVGPRRNWLRRSFQDRPASLQDVRRDAGRAPRMSGDGTVECFTRTVLVLSATPGKPSSPYSAARSIVEARQWCQTFVAARPVLHPSSTVSILQVPRMRTGPSECTRAAGTAPARFSAPPTAPRGREPAVSDVLERPRPAKATAARRESRPRDLRICSGAGSIPQGSGGPGCTNSARGSVLIGCGVGQ